MNRSSPEPFLEVFDGARRDLESASSQDGFLFSGNRQESVPRALFFDRRLTPLERNAWQVCRMRLNGDGVTAFPTYEELRPLLATTPCGTRASHETVARALMILRLTRWLTLARRRRDPKTGRLRSNLYVLHDEPLTPYEAIQLDPEYLVLLSRALSHSSYALRRVAGQVLQEIGEDPLLTGRILPDRLHILAQRMIQGNRVAEIYPQDDAMPDSEEGKKSLLRKGEPPSSDSEAGVKPSKTEGVTNPKKGRTTVRSCIYIKQRTEPRAREHGLRLPERFLELKEEQQDGALAALKQVDDTQRQAVLDEWTARCREGRIRHPAAYLFGIIQKAIRGQFHARAAPGMGTSPGPPVIPSQTASRSEPVPPDVARAYLTQLRAILSRDG